MKVPAVNKHLKNIFESGELEENSVISILETTAADRKSYNTKYYNLDAIIAVGYRINSYQATRYFIQEGFHTEMSAKKYHAKWAPYQAVAYKLERIVGGRNRIRD